MIKKITIRTLDRWNACCRNEGSKYDDAALKRLGFHKGLTPLEIANKRSIPVEDRIWALLRPSVLGRKRYNALGHRCADRAIKRHALRCGVSEVEAWARRGLSGEDRSEAAARMVETAWAAEAAKAAARAAGAAAWATRMAETAWAAEATWAARAAEAAERRWQLTQIRKELLNKKDEE